MVTARGLYWTADFGEIAEVEQFRVGTVDDDLYSAYFPIGQLQDLITSLTNVIPLGLGVLSLGTQVQSRKVSTGFHTEVVIEPRSDTFPPQIMRVELTTLSDFISVLTSLQAMIAGQDPADWDGSKLRPISYEALPPELSPQALADTFAPVRIVDMLTAGAVADGATDDWSVYVAARTAAGAKGTVHFPARSGASVTTYYLAGARPDLSGTNITADPGVVLKFADENPNTKALDLRSPVTIENVAQGITRAKPSNRDKSDMAAFAVAGGAQYEPLALTAVDFTSGWSAGVLTVNVGSTGTGSTTFTQLDACHWSTN